jgi:predicted RNase H-like HicB family nuclease
VGTLRKENVLDKYKVIWSEEDQEFVGLHEDYPSLSWLANTEEKALNGIRKLVELVILEEALKNFEECKHFVEIPNIMTCVSCVTTTQDLEEKIQSLAEQLFKTL